MSCRYVDCEQLSAEWWAAKRGIPSASKFKCIMTAKTLKLSASADEYIDELIGDVLDPEYGLTEQYTNAHLARGLAFEPESRSFYELETGQDTAKVGLVISDCGRFCCSPDLLVGDDGLVEMKNPSAKVHVGYIRRGGLLDDYRQQVHGQLIVTGRKWCDLFSYRPGCRPVIVRVVPDDYTAALRKALDQFHVNYQAALAFVRGEREAP